MRWLLPSLVALSGGAVLAAACANSIATDPPGSTNSSSSAGGGGVGGFEPTGGSGGGCECAPGPHNDMIYTLSDDGEIWAFDPVSYQFSYVRSLLCEGTSNPFSMAIDQQGVAWVLAAESNLLFQFDLSQDQGCEVANYTPHQADYDLFGMAFAGPPSSCPDLYVHSYSGNGSFSEGPGLGQLGVIDEDGVLTNLATIDYDGGELAGSGDGRLFAFTGNNPAKLVEYDKSDGSTIDIVPLTGFEKTNASAFSFFAGAIYFFTEAVPAGCFECMQMNCDAELTACQADPMCNEQLQCALAAGDISDECGGFMPPAMQTCAAVTCGNPCFLPSSAKDSQVTRFDLASYSGGDPTLEVVVDHAPIRIVGAGESVCVAATPL